VSRSKDKGTSWETLSKLWLLANGIAAGDMRQHGNLDRGDIAIPGITVECKNEKKYQLAQWIAELEAEVQNNRHDFGFVLAHRKGKASPADAYVITTGRLWLPVLEVLTSQT